ncbi:LLM class flavin-dependent oxidoreductase [Pseudonocardia halophobica]|uniref:LLM class flavin-dependent oxidoreductase n=1 Tax=Pseudonocardia halophobica TaxID=29401 RepID=UPI003D909809
MGQVRAGDVRVEPVGGDERYEIAAEWTTLVKMLWDRDKEFDFEGKWFTARNAISAPKPIQHTPAIMSAGSSPQGMDFAAGNADICFAAADSNESLAEVVKKIKDRAAEKGREVRGWTQAGILCGPDQANVQRQYDHWVREHGDYEAVGNQITKLMGGGGKTLDYKHDPVMLERMVAMMHSHPPYGTPAQIVEEMARLSEAGIDGINIVWPDYERGIEQCGTRSSR